MREKQKKNNKSEVHPARLRLVLIGLPTYMVLTVFLILFSVYKIETGEYFVLSWWTVVCALLFLGMSAGMIWLSSLVAKKEALAEMQRFAFLLAPPKPLEKDEVVVGDNEYTFTFTELGLKAEWKERESEGQVFDEVKENVGFIPWKTASVSLATQNWNRRVHIAIAVYSGETEDSAFVEMNEDVYSAVCAFGLDKQFGEGWEYLRYNPEDAFRQLLKRGFIREMYNKKTGKMFVDKHGNFLGDE